MVLTIEPGLYVPDDPAAYGPLAGIGVRIEDDVAIMGGRCRAGAGAAGAAVVTVAAAVLPLVLLVLRAARLLSLLVLVLRAVRLLRWQLLPPPLPSCSPPRAGAWSNPPPPRRVCPRGAVCGRACARGRGGALVGSGL